MDIQVKNVFVTSENRDTGLYPYGNAYTLYLTNPIKNIKKVELLYASVPNTLFNLTSNANFIAFSNTITEKTTAGNLPNFSIPSGFYGASSLATEITNAISNTTGITASYVSSEGKFLFTRSTAAAGPFSMAINTAEAAKLLGFNASVVGTVLNSDNVAVQTSLTVPIYSDNTTYRGFEFIKSTTIADLNVAMGVFLDVEELRTICNENADQLVGVNNTTASGEAYTTATTRGQTPSRSIGIIPLDVTSGSIKHFKKTSDYDLEVAFPYPIQKLDKLTVKWLDKTGQIINFNGADDNSFLLRFHVIPENKKY
jgi:hypothetical protein